MNETSWLHGAKNRSVTLGEAKVLGEWWVHDGDGHYWGPVGTPGAAWSTLLGPGWLPVDQERMQQQGWNIDHFPRPSAAKLACEALEREKRESEPQPQPVRIEGVELQPGAEVDALRRRIMAVISDEPRVWITLEVEADGDQERAWQASAPIDGAIDLYRALGAWLGV